MLPETQECTSSSLTANKRTSPSIIDNGFEQPPCLKQTNRRARFSQARHRGDAGVYKGECHRLVNVNTPPPHVLPLADAYYDTSLIYLASSSAEAPEMISMSSVVMRDWRARL